MHCGSMCQSFIKAIVDSSHIWLLVSDSFIMMLPVRSSPYVLKAVFFPFILQCSSLSSLP